ncbi:MAG: hypothetical protein ABJB66_20455, partial [Gemmatimonadaceae bacterium]
MRGGSDGLDTRWRFRSTPNRIDTWRRLRTYRRTGRSVDLALALTFTLLFLTLLLAQLVKSLLLSQQLQSLLFQTKRLALLLQSPRFQCLLSAHIRRLDGHVQRNNRRWFAAHRNDEHRVHTRRLIAGHLH